MDATDGQVEGKKASQISSKDLKSKQKQKKVSKRIGKTARRTKQLEVLKVEAKLAVGLESFGW